jgi:hypothetical protein
VNFLQNIILGWGTEVLVVLLTLSAIFIETYDKERKKLTQPGRYLLPVLILVAIAQGAKHSLETADAARETAEKEFERALETFRNANQVFPHDISATVSHQNILPVKQPPQDPNIFSQQWRLVLSIVSASSSNETRSLTMFPEKDNLDHSWKFRDFDDYCAHVHSESAFFLGKLGDLGRYRSADAWNDAKIKLSLKPPTKLELGGLANAIRAEETVKWQTTLSSNLYNGVEPQLEGLSDPVGISLFVRGQEIGTATGLWARLKYADDEVHETISDTFNVIQVPTSKFPVPKLSAFLRSDMPKRTLILSIGLICTLSSLILMYLAFDASRKETLKKN